MVASSEPTLLIISSLTVKPIVFSLLTPTNPRVIVRHSQPLATGFSSRRVFTVTAPSSRNTFPHLLCVSAVLLLFRPQLGAQLQQAFAALLRGPVTSQCEPIMLAGLEVIAEGKSGPTQLIPARGEGEGSDSDSKTVGARQSVLTLSDLGRG